MTDTSSSTSAHEVTAKIYLDGKPWDGKHVVGLEGVEGISRLFEFQVKLYCQNEIPLADFKKTLNRSVTLKLEREAASPAAARYVNGILGSLQLHDKVTDSNAATVYVYMATIVPRAWYHQHQSNCRVFRREPIGEMIKDVLLDGGVMSVKDFELKLSKELLNLKWTGGPRDDVDSDGGKEGFRVQYRETNWDFLCRLMEEYGIFYYFEHQWEDGKKPGHKLVIADTTAAYDNTKVSGFSPAVLRYRESVRPNSVELVEFNPDTDMPISTSASGKDKPDLKLRDYPGGYRYDASSNMDDGFAVNITDIRYRQARNTARLGEGAGDCVTLAPCRTIADTLTSGGAKGFVVTQVVHQCSQTDPLYQYTQGKVQYANHFSFIPDSVTFRPSRITPRPSIKGVQTAIVLGSGTKNAPYIDAYGRVQVKFHWETQSNSCWVRVSQVMAQRQGAERGAMWFPREGDEVIVDFIEGDPDQPIITGCVYMPSQTDAVSYTPYDPTRVDDTIDLLDVDAASAVKKKTFTVNNAYRNVFKDRANELSMVDDGQAGGSALLLKARDASDEDANLVTDADFHHARATCYYQDVGAVYRQHVGPGGMQQIIDGDQVITVNGNVKREINGSIRVRLFSVDASAASLHQLELGLATRQLSLRDLAVRVA